MLTALVIVVIAEATALVIGVRLFLQHDSAKDERHARETAKLLDRIQSPTVAVARSITEDLPPSPPAVSFDDDHGFWEAKEAMNGRTGSS